MTVYLFCLFSIVFYYFILKYFPFTCQKRNLYLCVIVGLQLFFIAVFRNVSVGGDLENYIPAYQFIGETPWKDLWHIPYETGYLLLNKILFSVTAEIRLFLGVVGGFIVWGYCRYVYRNSCIPWLSLFLFLAFGFFTESLSMLRQAVAMVIVLSGIKYVEQRKFFKYLGVILLGMTFHLTAIVALLLYPFFKIKLNLLNFLLLLGGCGLFMKVAGNLILNYLTGSLYSLYASKMEAGTGISMFFLLLVITVGGLLIQGKQKSVYNYMMVLACCMQLFAIQFSLFARIVMYFSMAMLVFIPNTLQQIRDKEIRFYLKMLVCVLTTFYFIVFILERNLAGIMPYRFMWE